MTVSATTQTKVLLLALLLASCTRRAFDCNWNANCAEAGGAGGDGGATEASGSNTGGSSSASSSGGEGSSNGGTTSDACNAQCTGTTPVCNEAAALCVECLSNDNCLDPTAPACDTSSNTCVGCLGSGDCVDLAAPVCKTETTTCVACLANTDCPTETASLCDTTANACTACTGDDDCSHIEGKNVCSSGTCVQCSAANETACGTYSCNPATNVCTTTTRGSVNLCGACVADSECTSGSSGTIAARCVPMTFGGVARGNYCLEAVSSGCDQPFGSTSVMKITAISASGAASDDYCGINQTTATCEAIRDMQDAQLCSDGSGAATDALCGCRRDSSEVCTDAGAGGLCRNVSGANRCTIQCGSALECVSSYTCNTDSPNYCG